MRNDKCFLRLGCIISRKWSDGYHDMMPFQNMSLCITWKYKISPVYFSGSFFPSTPEISVFIDKVLVKYFINQQSEMLRFENISNLIYLPYNLYSFLYFLQDFHLSEQPSKNKQRSLPSSFRGFFFSCLVHFLPLMTIVNIPLHI